MLLFADWSARTRDQCNAAAADAAATIRLSPPLLSQSAVDDTPGGGRDGWMAYSQQLSALQQLGAWLAGLDLDELKVPPTNDEHQILE